MCSPDPVPHPGKALRHGSASPLITPLSTRAYVEPIHEDLNSGPKLQDDENYSSSAMMADEATIEAASTMQPSSPTPSLSPLTRTLAITEHKSTPVLWDSASAMVSDIRYPHTVQTKGEDPDAESVGAASSSVTSSSSSPAQHFSKMSQKEGQDKEPVSRSLLSPIHLSATKSVQKSERMEGWRAASPRRAPHIWSGRNDSENDVEEIDDAKNQNDMPRGRRRTRSEDWAFYKCAGNRCYESPERYDYDESKEKDDHEEATEEEKHDETASLMIFSLYLSDGDYESIAGSEDDAIGDSHIEGQDEDYQSHDESDSVNESEYAANDDEHVTEDYTNKLETKGVKKVNRSSSTLPSPSHKRDTKLKHPSSTWPFSTITLTSPSGERTRRSNTPSPSPPLSSSSFTLLQTQHQMSKASRPPSPSSQPPSTTTLPIRPKRPAKHISFAEAPSPSQALANSQSHTQFDKTMAYLRQYRPAGSKGEVEAVVRQSTFFSCADDLPTLVNKKDGEQSESNGHSGNSRRHRNALLPEEIAALGVKAGIAELSLGDATNLDRAGDFEINANVENGIIREHQPTNTADGNKKRHEVDLMIFSPLPKSHLHTTNISPDSLPPLILPTSSTGANAACFSSPISSSSSQEGLIHFPPESLFEPRRPRKTSSPRSPSLFPKSTTSVPPCPYSMTSSTDGRAGSASENEDADVNEDLMIFSPKSHPKKDPHHVLGAGDSSVDRGTPGAPLSPIPCKGSFVRSGSDKEALEAEATDEEEVEGGLEALCHTTNRPVENHGNGQLSGQNISFDSNIDCSEERIDDKEIKSAVDLLNETFFDAIENHDTNATEDNEQRPIDHQQLILYNPQPVIITVIGMLPAALLLGVAAPVARLGGRMYSEAIRGISGGWGRGEDESDKGKGDE
ncbi:unnamed protein product [Periconia digitata]|uniref:Uncharacterized protein n=1 Tax=Periconia digitata TaxID=1303443 RepID=A0A9W4XH11_9PLEO|nr:unnamed protein product [Periconia digitata]